MLGAVLGGPLGAGAGAGAAIATIILWRSDNEEDNTSKDKKETDKQKKELDNKDDKEVKKEVESIAEALNIAEDKREAARENRIKDGEEAYRKVTEIYEKTGIKLAALKASNNPSYKQNFSNDIDQLTGRHSKGWEAFHREVEEDLQRLGGAATWRLDDSMNALATEAEGIEGAKSPKIQDILNYRRGEVPPEHQETVDDLRSLSKKYIEGRETLWQSSCQRRYL